MIAFLERKKLIVTPSNLARRKSPIKIFKAVLDEKKGN